MIHIHHKKLEYYNGNYDTFVKTREDLLVNQLKQFKWEQEQIKSMKEYIAINQSKNSKQAESKRKVLQKMERSGLTAKPEVEKGLNFQFVSATRISYTFTLSHCNIIIITHLLTLFLAPSRILDTCHPQFWHSMMLVLVILDANHSIPTLTWVSIWIAELPLLVQMEQGVSVFCFLLLLL